MAALVHSIAMEVLAQGQANNVPCVRVKGGAMQKHHRTAALSAPVQIMEPHTGAHNFAPLRQHHFGLNA